MKLTRMAAGILLIAMVAGCREEAPSADPSPAPATEGGADSTQPAQAVGVVPQAAQGKIEGASTTSCNIETVNDVSMDGARPTVSLAQPLRFAGWYINEKRHDAGPDLSMRVVRIDNGQEWEVKVADRLERSDVASSRGGDNAYLESGFQLTLDLQAFSKGDYGLFLLDAGASGEPSVCGTGRGFALE
ncbi:MAG: hypothetical protein QM795_01440 [Pseudoxanthomonas sp.]